MKSSFTLLFGLILLLTPFTYAQNLSGGTTNYNTDPGTTGGDDDNDEEDEKPYEGYEQPNSTEENGTQTDEDGEKTTPSEEREAGPGNSGNPYCTCETGDCGDPHSEPEDYEDHPPEDDDYDPYDPDDEDTDPSDEPTNGSLSITAKLFGEGALSKGNVRFFTHEFANPGRVALRANIPSNFTTDSTSLAYPGYPSLPYKRINSINAGSMRIDFGDASAQLLALDPNAFTATVKNAAGQEIRKTTISFVAEGGTNYFRMDVEEQGHVTRYQQTNPVLNKLVLESGSYSGGVFAPTRRITTVKNFDNPTLRKERTTREERISVSQPYQVVRDEEIWREAFMKPDSAVLLGLKGGATAGSKSGSSSKLTPINNRPPIPDGSIRGYVTDSNGKTYRRHTPHHYWRVVRRIIDPDGLQPLTSTWEYYSHTDTTGGFTPYAIGRVKRYQLHDGRQASFTYSLNKDTVKRPFAGDPEGLVTVAEWNPGTRTRTITRTVSGQTLSKIAISHTPTTLTTKRYTSAGNYLTTVTTYKADGQLFGGFPTRIDRPDGTSITYDFTRTTVGGIQMIRKEGYIPGNNAAPEGLSLTQVTNSFGRTILREVKAMGHGDADGKIYESMAVTAVDKQGRATDTAYFPVTANADGEVAVASSSTWTTNTVQFCCGPTSVTDRTGITTYYAYDAFKRQIKSNTLGVTTETQYKGLTTETYRYPETVFASLSPALNGTESKLVSRSVRNLTGTIRESWTPNPTSTAPGALVKSSSSTTVYKPASNLASRTTTTTADNFSQTTDSFLDGRPAKTYGALSPAMEYSYSMNSTGQVTSVSYLDGATLRETTSAQSDWAGRTSRINYMDGAFATMHYNSKGQMIRSVDPDGIVTLLAYNSEGKQTTSATDLFPNSSYDDEADNISYGTDAVQFTETIPAMRGSVPVWRSISKVWYTQGANVLNPIVSQSDSRPNGLQSWSWQIGQGGPTPDHVNSIFVTTVTTLNGNGSWTTTSNAPDGTKTVNTYTEGKMASRVVKDTTNAITGVIESETQYYDSLNRPTISTHSRTGASTTTYLSLTADIVKSVSDPGGRVTAFTYDIRGRQISTTLPDETTTQSTYTPRGKLASQSGSQTYPTSYTYDYASRMKTLTNTGAAGSAITAWNYSPTTGKLLTKKYNSNLSGTTGTGPSYTYTAARRIKTRIQASGKHSRYDHDAGGRLININYFTATNADNGTNAGNDTLTPNVTVSYDSLNRPASVSNKIATTAYSYISSNLTLASETVSYDWNQDQTPDLVRVIDRTRDNLRRPSGFEVKNGTTIENSVGYQFSATHGRMDKVSSVVSPSVVSTEFNYTYTPGSNLIATITSPVHTVSNVYETTRNALASKVNKVEMTTISAFTYNVNNIGQRTSVDVDGTAFAGGQRDRAWNYDSFGQLMTETDANNTAFNRGFTYDSIGNRTASINGNTDTTANGAISYTSNNLNQYSAVGSFTPTQDDDGNSIQTQIRASGLGTTALSQATFVWDGENRLIEVKNISGNTIAKYEYDAMSRRVRRNVTGGVNIAYLYNGWNPIAEYDTSTSTPTLRLVNVWGIDLSGSGQGAGGVGGLLGVMVVSAGTADRYFPTFDGNGNVSEYIDVNGAIAAHFEYDAFGNVVNYTESAIGIARTFSHRFSTKQQDDETGLLYYGYRYLDTITGRWPSRDPIQERGGINLYGFVGNDGVNYRDYLGLSDDTSCDGFFGLVKYFFVAQYNNVNSAVAFVDDGVVNALVSVPQGFFWMGDQMQHVAALDFGSLGSPGTNGDIVEAFGNLKNPYGKQGYYDPNGTPAYVRDSAVDALVIVYTLKAPKCPTACVVAQTETELSVGDKLARYLLNKDHPVGGMKAKWFDEALGFTQDNADDLARQLTFDSTKAVETAVTEFGTKFNQIIDVVGANGRTIPVKVTWIRNNDGVVRIVTAVPGD